jgi:Spy/CpxP family protein refolding chaperone
MRSIKSKIVLMLILALIAGTAVNAQPASEKTHEISGFSEDLKAQIHKLRISHLKDIQGIQNQIGENRAHYKSLMTSENPDMNAINKNIDDRGSLRSQLQKKQAAHIQDIRKLLNDEQRLIFDRKLTEMENREGNRQGNMRGRNHTGFPSWNKGKGRMNEVKGEQQ